jgi:hypothetical protein
VESETGTCSETCDVHGSKEGSIKVDDATHLKEDIPEAVIYPPINTGHEVRLRGVCVRFWQLTFLGHYCPKKEIVKLYLFISCFGLWYVCHIPYESCCPNAVEVAV